MTTKDKIIHTEFNVIEDKPKYAYFKMEKLKERDKVEEIYNEELNKLNIEYRRKWGVASHVDYTWWETYGDKAFDLGIQSQKQKIIEEMLDFQKNKMFWNDTEQNWVVCCEDWKELLKTLGEKQQ